MKTNPDPFNKIPIYVGRALKTLEIEEQAHVRDLVRKGILAWESRKTSSGVVVTYIKRA
jgi:hypothetical protein